MPTPGDLTHCPPKGRNANISRNITKGQSLTEEPQEAQALHHFAVCLFQVYREASSPVGKQPQACLFSSVHVLAGDKYTVFNSVHLVKENA